MGDNGHDRRAAATGSLLSELLSARPRYIRAWRVHGDRQRGEINQRAVAKVIALYLWDEGIRPDTDTNLPLMLKNVVNRALLGQRLTAQALQYFIGAFDMDEEDQRELWRLFAGTDGAAHTVPSSRGMARRQWHRTVALFENYYVDVSGTLAMRRTVQCIEAKEDNVDKYLFNHEPAVAEIEVLQGGRIGRHYEYGDGLVADDIILDRSRMTGERASLEYSCRYQRDAQVSEVRRPARGRTANVSITVHFTPPMLPDRVWYSLWADHFQGAAVEQNIVSLTPGGAASVCLPYIEQTVVGFRWQW